VECRLHASWFCMAHKRILPFQKHPFTIFLLFKIGGKSCWPTISKAWDMNRWISFFSVTLTCYWLVTAEINVDVYAPVKDNVCPQCLHWKQFRVGVSSVLSEKNILNFSNFGTWALQHNTFNFMCQILIRVNNQYSYLQVWLFLL
jgi:hypothetical protein